MKHILAISVVLITALGSCKKDKTCARTENPTVAPASEVQAIQTYLTANNITATQDPSGVFYTISAPGTGTGSPNLCSEIEFRYKGMLTNGSVFDDSGTSSVTYALGDLILGWQKVIPKLKKGGKMRCYIPPTLGYGSRDITNGQGVVIIPKNSTLIFDIELVNF